MSGPDVSSPYSMFQSNLLLTNKTFANVEGTKIGVDWTWAKQADTDVYKNFEKSVHILKAAGCHIESIPLPEIDLGEFSDFYFFTFKKSFSRCGPFDNIFDRGSRRCGK